MNGNYQESISSSMSNADDSMLSGGRGNYRGNYNPYSRGSYNTGYSQNHHHQNRGGYRVRGFEPRGRGYNAIRGRGGEDDWQSMTPYARQY